MAAPPVLSALLVAPSASKPEGDTVGFHSSWGLLDVGSVVGFGMRFFVNSIICVSAFVCCLCACTHAHDNLRKLRKPVYGSASVYGCAKVRAIGTLGQCAAAI